MQTQSLSTNAGGQPRASGKMCSSLCLRTDFLHQIQSCIAPATCTSQSLDCDQPAQYHKREQNLNVVVGFPLFHVSIQRIVCRRIRKFEKPGSCILSKMEDQMVVVLVDAARRHFDAADCEALIQPSLEDVTASVSRVELLSEPLFCHPPGQQVEKHARWEIDAKFAGALIGADGHT